MTDSPDMKTWSSPNGVTVSAVQRPDGAWLIRLPDEHPEEWGTLLQRVSADVRSAKLIIRPADQGELADAELREAGFAPFRQEVVWRIPVKDVLSRPKVTTTHRLVPVTDLDADAVAELDNAIRRDIPGTEGWVGTGAELLESLDDPEFDPALYRVAQHLETGSLDGLIRVWNRDPEPRIGCIGVTRKWRRTRLALALVQDVATTLHARGVSHVVTETDTTNRDSYMMARRQGGEAIRATIAWQKDIPSEATI